MGQRLNIEIISDGTVLANCYYHWSAYTQSALELTKIILDSLEGVNDEKNIVDKAVLLLQATGATLLQEEYAVSSKNENFLKYQPNRNSGLIAVSEKGINDTRCWEEGRVVIDISDRVVDFDVFFHISEEDEGIDELTDFPFYPYEISFDDFEEFHMELLNIIQADKYYIKADDLMLGIIC